MLRSMRITSGFSLRDRSTACRPVIASPTMSISGKSRSMPWTPARKTAGSSADQDATRSFTRTVRGADQGHDGAFQRLAHDFESSSHQLGPLAHPHQAVRADFPGAWHPRTSKPRPSSRTVITQGIDERSTRTQRLRARECLRTFERLSRSTWKMTSFARPRSRSLRREC